MVSFANLIFYADGLRYDGIYYDEVSNQSAWRNKPAGGLWASPVGHPHDWVSWCAKEFCCHGWRPPRNYSGGTFFTLKPDARVAMLITPAIYDRVSRHYPLRESPEVPLDPTMLDVFAVLDNGEDPTAYTALDFEAMRRDGVDAIYCEPALMRYQHCLAPVKSWDCATLLVLNPLVMRDIKCSCARNSERLTTATAFYPSLRDHLVAVTRLFSQPCWVPEWVSNLLEGQSISALCGEPRSASNNNNNKE